MRPSGVELSVFVVLAGCGGPPAGAPQPEDVFGAYRFAQRMPEDGSVLEGQFIITRDTIYARSATGACDYERGESDGHLLVYQCGAFKLRFDRIDPARRVSYFTIVSVRKTPASCRGVSRATCDQTNRNSVVLEPRSGLLRAVRIGS
jgi:hypothetical protein